MKKMKKNSELLAFKNVSNAFIQATPQDIKLKSIVLKQLKVVAKVLQEGYEEEVEELRIDNCLVYVENDKEGHIKGQIVRDDKGGYVFSKEGLRKFNLETKTLLKKEVEIGVFLKVENLKDCPVAYKDFFVEFINGETEEKEEEKEELELEKSTEKK